MEISSNAFSSGLNGIQAGQRRVEQAASDIASNAVTEPQQPSQTPPQNQVNPRHSLPSRRAPTWRKAWSPCALARTRCGPAHVSWKPPMRCWVRSSTRVRK